MTDDAPSSLGAPQPGQSHCPGCGASRSAPPTARAEPDAPHPNSSEPPTRRSGGAFGAGLGLGTATGPDLSPGINPDLGIGVGIAASYGHGHESGLAFDALDDGDGGAADVGPTPSWPRAACGVLLGCATALLHTLFFLLAGVALIPWWLRSSARGRALTLLARWGRRLTKLERMRRSAFFFDRFPQHYEASDQKILGYLATRSYTGVVCGVVVALLGFGGVLAAVLLTEIAQGSLSWAEFFSQVPLGCVLLFLDIQGLDSLAALDARLAHECFGPSERELLRRRIDELATSRAAVVQAVDIERRRIERDLHDGVQQRLVALAMLLGRARRGRHPEQAAALLLQAHQESQDVITELREATWRIYPSALDSLGLEEAIGGVSERCSIPLRLEFDVDRPLPKSVEVAAYFVVSEAVNNAAKHSDATQISVRLALHGAVLVVRIEDNGGGGANPAGSGLTGLRSRVGALDGVLRIDSPLGGPTTLTAELPCV